MADTPLKTPLFDAHAQFGARMVDFAGWSMPVQFSGITEEHVHTRTACSLFDVSHMGRLKLSGADSGTLLDLICTRNLTGAEVGRSYYTHICREDGGVLDDVIVSRFEEHWGVVCNASNRQKIVSWIERHGTDKAVTLTDETLSTAMVAIQGPRTIEVAGEIADIDLADLKRYRFRVFELLGMPITVYRSGYTGEDGFEIVVPAGLVALFLPKLLGSHEQPHPVIRPAGLGARDTLRIEAAMPLYGHELSEAWDSLTAGQAWCVDLSKPFIGRDAMRDLSERGLPRKLVGLALDGRRIARQGYRVFQGEREIGEVTSGTLSPTLGKSIAMALVRSDCSDPGTGLDVEMGSKRTTAEVVKLPFYKRPQ